MRVKFKTLSASAFGVIQAGDIVELNDGEAKLLIEAGYAEPVKEDKPAENAEVAEEAPKKETPKKKGKKKAE